MEEDVKHWGATGSYFTYCGLFMIGRREDFFANELTEVTCDGCKEGIGVEV